MLHKKKLSIHEKFVEKKDFDEAFQLVKSWRFISTHVSGLDVDIRNESLY